MARLTTTGLILLVLLTLGAYAASSATAEEGALPLVKKGFKVTVGEAIYETLTNSAIRCSKLVASGALTTDQHGTGTADLEGCKTLGVGVRSLGDAKEVILVKVEFTICLINSATLLFGVAIQAIETSHIEVPTLGLLILLKGIIIAHNLSGNEPASTFLADITGKSGEQTDATECKAEGKTFKYSLETNPDSETVDEMESVNAVNPTVTFEEKVTLMDT